MIARPLPNNATLEIVSNVSTLIGYVFSCEGSEGVTQEQRWVMYGGPAAFGGGALRPPEDPARCCTSLADWKVALAGGLWREGATYVKVHASCYSSRVDPEGSAPPFPEARRRRNTEGGVQMVDIQLTIAQEGSHIGDVFGTELSPIGETGLQGNREYWVMHREPDAGAPVILSATTISRGVKEFLDATFIEGSTLTIASCTYFRELPDNP